MTDSKDERALRVLSVLSGSLSVVAYPLVQIYGARPLVLMFAIPLALATTGRLLGRRRLEPLAAGVVVAMVVAVAARMWLALEWMLVLGPVVVVWLVAEMLRGIDRGTSALWLVTAVVAYAAGLLLPGNASVSVAASAIALGGTFTLLRLPRRPDATD